jgi:hypothetical protein
VVDGVGAAGFGLHADAVRELQVEEFPRWLQQAVDGWISMVSRCKHVPSKSSDGVAASQRLAW